MIPITGGLHRREPQNYGPFDGRPLQMLHRAISGEKGYVVAIERWADACRIGCEFFRIGGFFAGEDDERFHLKVFHKVASAGHRRWRWP